MCLGVTMTTIENLMNHSSRLETGFLANRTMKILRESKRNLRENDEIIVKKGLEFIKTIELGREQVYSGRLGNNSVEAANAYSLTLAALIQEDMERSKNFAKLIKKIKYQLEDILDKKRISKKKAEDARFFFQMVMQFSIEESGRHFYDKVEANEWLV